MAQETPTDDQRHYLKDYVKLNEQKDLAYIDLIKHSTLLLVGALTLMVVFIDTDNNDGNDISQWLYLSCLIASGLCILVSPILLYAYIVPLNRHLSQYRTYINSLQDGKTPEHLVLSASKPAYFDVLLIVFGICYFVFFISLIFYGLTIKFCYCYL